jgi:hypothetical protein
METVARGIALIVALLPVLATGQPRGEVSHLGEGRDNVMQNWEISRQQWQA